MRLALPADGVLKSTEVHGVSLDPGHAVPVLHAIAEGHAPRLRPGASVAFFARAAGLALEMGAGGRVVPALTREANGFAAKWLPLESPQDATRIAALSASIPPVCRAEVTKAHPDGPPATSVVAEFISGTLDALVRGAARWRSVLCVPTKL